MASKEVREFIRRAKADGWEICRRANHGTQLVHAATGAKVVVPGTPSDVRTLRNVETRMQRALDKVSAVICTRCERMFMTSDGLRQHIRVDHLVQGPSVIETPLDESGAVEITTHYVGDDCPGGHEPEPEPDTRTEDMPTLKRDISHKVFRFLHEHPDESFSIYELGERLGYTPQQASNAAGRLARLGTGVQRPMRGVYTYAESEPDETETVEDQHEPETGVLFEKVAETVDRQLILRAEDGTIWLAKRI